MKKELSLSDYRAIDLAIFSVLMIVFEVLAVKALSWFNMLYISLFLALSLIVTMRWGLWGSIVIIIGSLVYSAMNKFELNNYLISVIGSLFILLLNLLFLIGKDKIKKTGFLLLYVTLGFILLEVGRASVAAILGDSFFQDLGTLLLTDLLNYVIALIVIFIANRLDGVFEDQITYIKRIKKEEEQNNKVKEIKDEESKQ